MTGPELRRLIAEARADRRGAIRAARARQRQWRAELDTLAAAAWQVRAGWDADQIADRIAALIEPNATTNAGPVLARDERIKP
jgi:hypothetical protein